MTLTYGDRHTHTQTDTKNINPSLELSFGRKLKIKPMHAGMSKYKGGMIHRFLEYNSFPIVE